MKAKVNALNKVGGKDALTTVNNKPVKIGDIVDVDENTFRNLARKGILEAADKESAAVKLDKRSTLSEEEAAARQAEAARRARANKAA